MRKLSRTEWAWVTYDFGNSAYALMVMTLFFPIFFRRYVASGENVTALWGIAVASSSLLAGLVAPFLGAFTDRYAKRKSYFVLFSAVAAAGTILLSFAADMPWLLGMLLFIIVNASFAISLSLYDSFVVVVGRQSSTSLSGVGWGVGYIGGLVCLALAWWGLGRLPDSLVDYRVWFLFTGLFYVVCSIWPYFSFPKDPGRGAEVWPSQRSGFAGIQDAMSPLRHWREFKGVFVFLGATYLLMDGLSTLVYFIALFSEGELGLSLGQTVQLMIIVQFVAIFATIGMSLWADKVGELEVLIVCAVIWIFLSIAIYQARSFETFRYIALLTGLVVGSTPAIARGYLAKCIPIERRAEFFGFNTLVGRVATLLGPLLYGIAASIWGMRAAIFVVIPFFVAGALVLLFLRMARVGGRKSARGMQDE